ncbi:Potassium-transporting ATPase KdpC subunit [Usitatibacter rugosus]|uniref:Potassium-transporting ATPase KdpC subunit n=1 Tax=Usitatibacter rugosus TaxID=2732067 RepID=A0A6M4GYA2_9PROT|nr:potassium-transporting ATPase subunit KdpC [Usitatibacter rugosus]QJR12226.1 Potassium-transporting ATPase KdpC subunit [Usitatibacter rugosus]
MLKELRPALVLTVALTVVTGVAYPLAVTGVGAVVFPSQAGGSLVMQDGKPVASELIGQPYSDPKHFWSRASATSPYPYNAAASSGSNQGPLNPALAEAVAARVKALRDADPGNNAPVPVDLVTASGSGLDPHISPEGAEYQVARVARARNLDAAKVRALVAANTEGRQLGVLGEPRVNVVMLNLALDAAR